jgi:hypothetical protein
MNVTINFVGFINYKSAVVNMRFLKSVFLDYSKEADYYFYIPNCTVSYSRQLESLSVTL